MRQSGQDQQTAAWRKNMHSEPPARHDDFFGETVSIHDALPARPAPMAVAVERPATISGRIGQYEIIRALGRGGMGEVHLARDLRLGRLVAVKLLTGQRVRLTERFLAEARTTARCNHENIVVIHEVGEHAGDPYMVLEYLEGQTLRQWLEEQSTPAVARGASMRAHAPVPPGRAVELMLPVVRALAYAHERGIVHRDLKPENIMLTHAGTIKVLDFGIAKLLSVPEHLEGTTTTPELLPSAMSSSALIGTLPYMSPEQMNMGAIDHRSDLWAVGIMLFEMVTGRHPVPSLSMGDLLDVADDEMPMPSVRERMPDIGPLGAVIDRCLLKNPLHRTTSARELVAELEALAPGHRMVRLRHDGNPFAGLAAFQEADADRFFGRTRDIDQVVAQLRSRPLVAVVGPSGVGKSSLIRAGVIPALKRSGEGWDACVVRPGRQPLAALAGALAQVSTARGTAQAPRGDAASPVLDGASSGEIDVERLRTEPGYLGVQLRARAAKKLRRILVFVDQFEELYTLGTPASERAAFLACLTGMADDAASPLRVVLSMRSDFLDRLAEDRQFGAEVTRGLVLLPPMGREGLREALTRPVEANELRFESDALVDRMVDALDATVGALPLLQFTAAWLWELRDVERRLLTEASYEQIAGVAGALASHADSVLAGMSSPRQALARTVFERLVTPERTRALVSTAELREMHGDPDAVDDLIQHLAAMRLVVIESGAEGADHTVELVHESLIDRWPTLARWLDDNQEDAVFLDQLRAAAKQWEARGQSADLLWRGETLEEARSWRRRYRGMLPPLHEQFLSSGMVLAARTARIKRVTVSGIIVFLSLLVVAAAVALVMIRSAEQLASEQAQVASAAGARAEAKAAEARAAEEKIRAQLDIIRTKEAERIAARDQAETFQERVHESEEDLAEKNRQLVAALTEAERARDRARQAQARAETTSQQLEQALAKAEASHQQAESLLRQERDRLERRLKELGAVTRGNRALR
jgi:serine/threonine protein kinase/energy-coupling factor transporter ATP-binding protein EcfA2